MTKTVAAGLIIGACLIIGAQGTAAQLATVYVQHCQATGARWTLCSRFIIDQTTPSLGGPQALEGYTRVAHQTGTVALAIGTVGNVEILGAGDVTSARGIQGGVVISGPGRIGLASSLVLMPPQRQGGYDGPVNIDRSDYITFGNAGSIRPGADDSLLVCDAQNHCHPL